MSKPYDAITKTLMEDNPLAWLDFVGILAAGPVQTLNVDLSTVTSAADYVLRVNAPHPLIVHFEFVSGYQTDLLFDSATRSLLLAKRERIGVESVIVLLHPKARHGQMNGTFSTLAETGGGITFRYKLVEAWTYSSDQLLACPPAIMPLAVLSKDVRDRQDAQAVLNRLHDRLMRELAATPDKIKELWTSAEVLLGLKFHGEDHKAWIKKLTRGVLSVKESIIYQDIFDEGRTEGRTEGEASGIRETLLKWGTKRFGQPNEGEKVALEAIIDINRLKRLADRMDEVSCWTELLEVQ